MSAASERVFEFLDEEEEEQVVANPADISRITGEVTFEKSPITHNDFE